MAAMPGQNDSKLLLLGGAKNEDPANDLGKSYVKIYANAKHEMMCRQQAEQGTHANTETETIVPDLSRSDEKYKVC